MTCTRCNDLGFIAYGGSFAGPAHTMRCPDCTLREIRALWPLPAVCSLCDGAGFYAIHEPVGSRGTWRRCPRCQPPEPKLDPVMVRNALTNVERCCFMGERITEFSRNELLAVLVMMAEQSTRLYGKPSDL